MSLVPYFSTHWCLCHANAFISVFMVISVMSLCWSILVHPRGHLSFAFVMDIHLHLISYMMMFISCMYSFFDGLLSPYQRTVTALHLSHILVSYFNKMIYLFFHLTYFFQKKKKPHWVSLITTRACRSYAKLL